MAGRRSITEKKLADEVITLISDELLSLTEAADRAGVPRRTVRSWLERNNSFAAAFRAACDIRTEGLFERLTRRAGQATEVAAEAERAGLNPNAAVGALRVECDNLRWALSKLAPARYGDRLAAEFTGKDGKDLIPPSEATDPGKLALGILAIVQAAKPKESPQVDHDPADAWRAGLPAPERRIFDPQSGRLVRTITPVADPRLREIAGAAATPVSLSLGLNSEGRDGLSAPPSMSTDAWAGRVAPRIGSPAQEPEPTTEAMRREIARVEARRAGIVDDPPPNRTVVRFRGGS